MLINGLKQKQIVEHADMRYAIHVCTNKRTLTRTYPRTHSLTHAPKRTIFNPLMTSSNEKKNRLWLCSIVFLTCVHAKCLFISHLKSWHKKKIGEKEDFLRHILPLSLSLSLCSPPLRHARISFKIIIHWEILKKKKQSKNPIRF